MKPYPSVICLDCGITYGRRPVDHATWYPGTCGVCANETFVTEPRDFGHLKPGWKNHKKELHQPQHDV